MPPAVSPIVKILTILGILSIPAVGFLLGRVFDRWCARRPGRLVALSAVLALVASALLLVLPLYFDPVQTSEGRLAPQRRSALAVSGLSAVGVAAIPVAIAAAPLVMEPFLAGVHSGRLASGVAAALRTVAVLLLVVVMYLGSMSLVGLFYLPSVAAMGAAVARSGVPPSRPSGAGGPEAPGTPGEPDRRGSGGADPQPVTSRGGPRSIGSTVATLVAAAVPLAFLAVALLVAIQTGWTRETAPVVATRTVIEPPR